MLPTREQFREGVFQRDNGKCVFCDAPAVDAHHIMERRLWPDGGYYLDNGASVCQEHHLACERTDITVEEVREACGITTKCIPPHLYPDHVYDKWGNHIYDVKKDLRAKGELFYDESVQKIIKNHLDKFLPFVKYPRTYHLPWSEGCTDDDRMLQNISAFEGRRVIVTEKMDGENATLYTNYYHARSIDGNSHPSQKWIKAYAANRAYNIPEGWRVCGENLYATHSIHYENLECYFQVFSIWNDKNNCLSWDETVEWCDLLDFVMVPVLYDGIYDEMLIKSLYKNREETEGYVIRVADGFHYSEFSHKVGKFVRKDHVKPTQHNWKFNWDDRKINSERKT